ERRRRRAHDGARGHRRVRPHHHRDLHADPRRHAADGRADLGGAGGRQPAAGGGRSEEHTSELQSRENLVCRLLLERKKLTVSASFSRSSVLASRHALPLLSFPTRRSSDLRTSPTASSRWCSRSPTCPAAPPPRPTR